MDVGIRELRSDLAARVRRAGAGERVVIRVGGRPIAQLGPLDDATGQVTLADLAARGLITPPRRTRNFHPPEAIMIWQGTRLDRVLRDIRG
jgi:antitoxin (DNA-binding transcriptional repressor) of toxin-antitoxin stability system